MADFKLIHGEDGLEVNFRVTSGKLRREIYAILKKRPADEKQVKMLDVMSKYSTNDSGAESAIMQAIKNGDLKAEDVVAMNDTDFDIQQKLDDLVLEQFKTIIDTKQLQTPEKELLAKPITDDFWQEQDIAAIEAALNSFRLKLGVRQQQD
jgi:hypothetical protein